MPGGPLTALAIFGLGSLVETQFTQTCTQVADGVSMPCPGSTADATGSGGAGVTALLPGALFLALFLLPFAVAIVLMRRVRRRSGL